MSFYEYYFEQIESRVLADCNRERLKEHRQCDYCHLCFDCKAYKERMGIDLCKFLDNYEGGKRMNNIFDIDNLMDDIPLTYEECNEVDDTNYAEEEAILDEWLKNENEYDAEEEALLDEWLKSEERGEKNE